MADQVYIIAEAGSNHDHDLAQAKALIDVAASAGADAVKFQTFRADALYPQGAGNSDYLGEAKSIYDIIKSLEMPLAWIPELAEHARNAGLDFLSTPFDEASANALAPYVSMFKIASYEMTHHGLVQHCARFGKRLLISTGTATLEEVTALVDALHAVATSDFALLQCTAKYPAPMHALNLRAMQTLARTFGCPVGFSDHSREPLIGPVAAVALGASVIEKHFTLNNNLPGPDHIYALEPDELRAMVRAVRSAEAALGDGVKEPQPEEMELRSFARRSVFCVAPIARGGALSVRNARVLRAGKLAPGVAPARYLHMLGRSAQRALQPGDAPIDADLAPLRLQHDDVLLRPLAPPDAGQLFLWRQDETVAHAMFSPAPPTRPQHEAWMERLQRRTDRVDFIVAHQDKDVGVVLLSDIDLGARTAEYGVYIGEPNARGHGVAEKASRALLRYAFDVLDLDKVGLEYFEDNTAARALYTKLGFVKVDMRPKVLTSQMRPVARAELHRG